MKTDQLEAKRFALMLRSGMFAESHIPKDEIPELRDHIRTRKDLIDGRTVENRVRSVLKRTANAYESELFGPNGREFLAELSLSTTDRTTIEAHFSVINEYNKQIKAIKNEIGRHVLESDNSRLQLSLQKWVKLISLILITLW